MIEFSALRRQDAQSLSNLILSDPPEYRQYFTPFSFDEESISEQLAENNFWGIYLNKELAGFCMVRFQGYTRPSLGLYVAQPYARKGLGTEAIKFMIDWCEKNGVLAVMLHVDERNPAKKLYEQHGFTTERHDDGQFLLARSIYDPRAFYDFSN